METLICECRETVEKNASAKDWADGWRSGLLGHIYKILLSIFEMSLKLSGSKSLCETTS